MEKGSGCYASETNRKTGRDWGNLVRNVGFRKDGLGET